MSGILHLESSKVLEGVFTKGATWQDSSLLVAEEGRSFDRCCSIACSRLCCCCSAGAAAAAAAAAP
eukprot:1159038-Pelagomonas_calceolata.AAC.4